MRKAVLLGILIGGFGGNPFAQEDPTQGALPAAPGAAPPLGRPAATSPIIPGSSPADVVPETVQGIHLGTGEIVTITNTPSAASAAAAAMKANMAALLRAQSNAVGAAQSNITPAQFQNINRLTVALNGLGLPGRDAADQQRGLTEVLQAAPISGPQLPASTIASLGQTVAAVVPSLNLTAPQRRQLAIDLNLALNSAKLSPDDAERVLADLRGLLQGSAIHNPAGVEQLQGQVTDIVSDLQSGQRPGEERQGRAAAIPERSP